MQKLALTVSKRHRKTETFSSSLSGFLNLSTVDIWVICHGDCPVCEECLAATLASPQLLESTTSPDIARHCLLGVDYPKLGTTALNVRFIPRLPQVLSIRAQRYLVSQSVSQSCPTLCDPKDCRLPGSSVHGILQARRLDWVAILSSQPRDQTQIFCIAGRFFIVWATREAIEMLRET